MTSIAKPPSSATLRALLERYGAFLQSQGVDVAAELEQPSSSTKAIASTPSSSSTSSEPRNKTLERVVAPSAFAAGRDPELAGAVQQLGRAQRRARARAARDRLGHKHGARAKADKRRRLDRQRRAEERYQRRFRERCKTWLAAADAMPRMMPRALWLEAWDWNADGTGAALRHAMRAEPNKIALGAAVRAALECDEHDRDPRRTWADPAARASMTIALVLLRLAVPDRSKGGWTGGVVRGTPLGALAACVTPPGTGAAAPHRNTLTGRHRGARSDRRRGQVGYLRALQLAGFCFARQPRITERDVQPFEIGPKGYSCKRYWIVSASPSSATSEAMRTLLVALHRAGRLALLARPRPVQKPAFFRAQHPTDRELAAPS